MQRDFLRLAASQAASKDTNENRGLSNNSMQNESRTRDVEMESMLTEAVAHAQAERHEFVQKMNDEMRTLKHKAFYAISERDVLRERLAVQVNYYTQQAAMQLTEVHASKERLRAELCAAQAALQEAASQRDALTENLREAHNRGASCVHLDRSAESRVDLLKDLQREREDAILRALSLQAENDVLKKELALREGAVCESMVGVSDKLSRAERDAEDAISRLQVCTRERNEAVEGLAHSRHDLNLSQTVAARLKARLESARAALGSARTEGISAVKGRSVAQVISHNFVCWRLQAKRHCANRRAADMLVRRGLAGSIAKLCVCMSTWKACVCTRRLRHAAEEQFCFCVMRSAWHAWLHHLNVTHHERDKFEHTQKLRRAHVIGAAARLGFRNRCLALESFASWRDYTLNKVAMVRRGMVAMRVSKFKGVLRAFAKWHSILVRRLAAFQVCCCVCLW